MKDWFANDVQKQIQDGTIVLEDCAGNVHES
jgi:hypothetical protein